ncbi:acyltransferase family protein [Chryseobacterium sp. A301]
MKFRNDIQGLRAIAVLLVFLFHLKSQFLPGGFIGVDIFFVISGFLISSIIMSQKEQGKFNFMDFYIGRFKRIVPVLGIVLLTVLLCSIFIFLPTDIYELRKNVFMSSVFNSNNYLATLDNYFGASSSENPLLHTWTLSIEMQFYFLLPLFIIFINRKYLAFFTAAIIVALLSYSYYNSTFLNQQGLMYFSLFARIPEFLIGTIFAILLKKTKSKGKKIPRQNELSLIALILIIACAIIFNETDNFPGLIVLFPCLATGILLVCENSIISKFLSNKLFVHIGELSYSIYLWHWVIMAFIRYYNVEYAFNLFEVVIIIILTYSLSWLSYYYIETPFRKSSNKTFTLRLSAIYACLAILVITLPNLNSKFIEIPKRYSYTQIGVASHAHNFEKVEVLGDIHAKSDSILLLGDSHALIYKSILDTIGKENKFKFRTITNNLYPTIPGISETDFSEKRFFNQYKKLIAKTNHEIKQSKTIIISSIWSDKIPSLPTAVNKLLKNLNKDQKVIILADFPSLKQNPLRIYRGITTEKQNYNFEPTIKEIPNAILALKDIYSNLYILNIDYQKEFPNLPFINDTIAYYDQGHLNQYGSQAFGVAFSKRLNKSLQEIISK